MKHQSLFNIDDTRVNRIILLIISLLCSVHYVSYIISIISWVYTHDTLHIAFFALLHVFLISVFITYELTLDTSAGISRKDRMASQGGHTLMLAYFIGHSSLAEYIRSTILSTRHTLGKVARAAFFQAVYLSPPKICFTYMALSTVTSLADGVQHLLMHPERISDSNAMWANKDVLYELEWALFVQRYSLMISIITIIIVPMLCAMMNSNDQSLAELHTSAILSQVNTPKDVNPSPSVSGKLDTRRYHLCDDSDDDPYPPTR